MRAWWCLIRTRVSNREPSCLGGGGGKRMVIYYKSLLRGVAAHYRQSLETPYKNLPEDFKRVLLHGSGETEIEFSLWRAGKATKLTRPFEGVMPNLERLYTESESEFTRNRLKACMGLRPCDGCGGKRLRPEILAVTLGGAEASERYKNRRASAGMPGRKRPPDARSGEDRAVRQEPGSVRIEGLSIMDVCGLSVEAADEFFCEAEADPVSGESGPGKWFARFALAWPFLRT